MKQLFFNGMEKQTVFNKFDHLKLFVKKAWEYKNDWGFIKDPDKTLLDFVIKKYKLVEGEQIIRPIHFFYVGGDCDNQAVYIMSYFFYKFGWNVAKDLYLVTVTFNNGSKHIYLEFKNLFESFSFDALPKKYHYTKKDIYKTEYYRVSEL